MGGIACRGVDYHGSSCSLRTKCTYKAREFFCVPELSFPHQKSSPSCGVPSLRFWRKLAIWYVDRRVRGPPEKSVKITADRKYSAAAHNLLEKSYKGGKDPKEL